jgi:hypothetical protein
VNPVSAEIAIDADLHRRKSPVKFGEHVRQHVKAGGFIRSDGQRAARSAGLIGDGSQRVVLQREHPAGIAEQHFARCRKPHGFPDAIEKFLAVFLFELANLRANGRLRAEKLLSGARKAALLGDFEKCSEVVEIHCLVRRIIAKQEARTSPRSAERCVSKNGELSKARGWRQEPIYNLARPDKRRLWLFLVTQKRERRPGKREIRVQRDARTLAGQLKKCDWHAAA